MENLYSMYGGDIELKTVFNNDRHEYWVRDATVPDSEFSKVPGPTTALSILDKPMLVPWASKEAVKAMGWYEREMWTPDGYVPLSEEEQAIGYARMVSILERTKTMNPNEYWDALKQAKSAHTRKKEASADNGTLVHAWVEAFCKGENPKMPTLPLVVKGVEAWLRWIDTAGDVKFTLSEQKIYSKKYNYAGTLDFACTINGVPTMGDLKTSNFFSPSMFYQVSAYQLARQEEFPEEKYAEQIIVRCGKDGTLEVIKSTGFEQDSEAFIASWVIYKRMQEQKKIYGNT